MDVQDNDKRSRQSAWHVENIQNTYQNADGAKRPRLKRPKGNITPQTTPIHVCIWSQNI